VLFVFFRRYFAPAAQKPRGALMRSLRHALGPNFGSLCLAAWLLNLLQVGWGIGGRKGVLCCATTLCQLVDCALSASLSPCAHVTGVAVLFMQDPGTAVSDNI
jgi:hypothetical protein